MEGSTLRGCEVVFGATKVGSTSKAKSLLALLLRPSCSNHPCIPTSPLAEMVMMVSEVVPPEEV